jgi:hypothetical protein
MAVDSQKEYKERVLIQHTATQECFSTSRGKLPAISIHVEKEWRE